MSDRVLTTIERIQENHREKSREFFGDPKSNTYKPIVKEMTLDGLSQVIQSLVDKLDSLDRYVRDIRFGNVTKKETINDAEYEWFKNNKDYVKTAIQYFIQSQQTLLENKK